MSDRPSLIHIMGEFLKLIRLRSTCKRAKQACIITNVNMTSILAFGYNGRAAGEDNDSCTNEIGNCGCVHAEMNALVKTPYHAGPLYLFSTMSPCKLCARLIVNKGNIKAVFYLEAYRDMEHLHVLSSSGISCRLL